jgi:hypothetical protein
MFKPAILMLAAICAAPLCAGTVSIYATANSQLEQYAADNVWQDWGGAGSPMIIANWMPNSEITDIFRFSLATLPVGATITGARLWLYDTGWNDSNHYALYSHPDSSWDASSVTWNSFSTTSNVLVGSRDGSPGWQYNAWSIDTSAWNWAADLTQGAATFQLREGYGNFFANQNDFYSAAYVDPAYRPYVELDYSGGQENDPQAPEPGTFALLAGGLAAAAAIRVFRARGASDGTRG